MKAIFIYNNGKTFTAKNVIQGSIDIDNQRDENGKVERIIVSYQAMQFVDSDVIAAAVATILKTPPVEESFIESAFECSDILYGLDVLRSFDIDATAAGLSYIVVSPENDDDCTVETATLASESGLDAGYVVIPVDVLTPEMLADALSLTL